MYAYPSLFFTLLYLQMIIMYVRGWCYNKSLYVYFWYMEYVREGQEIIEEMKNSKKKK